LRDSFLESEWVTHSQNHVACLHRIGVAQFQWFKPRLINFQYGEIDFGVAANQTRLLRATIRELDFNIINLIDHMVIGDNVPFVRDNYARTERVLHQCRIIGITKLAWPAEKIVKRIECILSTDSNLF